MSGLDFTARALARLSLEDVAGLTRRMGDGQPLYAAHFSLAADGVTDDSEALLAALAALKTRVAQFDGYREGMAELVLPAGVIRVTQSGIFSSIASIVRGGYKLRGQGAESTVLWLDPAGTGTEKWFYDNGPSACMSFAVFEDICFSGGTDWHVGSPVTNMGLTLSNLDPRIKGFRFTGPGTEDGHTFTRCKFQWLEQVAEWAGSNNADTTRFTGCHFVKNKHQFLISNPQSMSILDLGGYTVNYGTYLKYGALGGGNFNKIGGAVIQLEDELLTSDVFVLDTSAGGPAGSNAPLLFSGIRFEMRGSHGRLAKMTADLACYAKFDTCSLANSGTVDKDIIELGGSQRALLDGCQVHDQSTGASKFKITSTVRKGLNPHLVFTRCFLPSAIHDNIVWNGGLGRLTIDELCAQNTVGAGQMVVEAIACDILGTVVSNSVSNRTQTRFTAPVANNAATNATGEYVITLPPYSEIVEVWAKVEPNGSTAATVQIHIGNDDKSLTYATSAAAPFSGGLIAHAAGIFKNAGTVATNRKVRIWLSNGAGGTPSTSINTAQVPMRSGVVWQ